MASDSNLVLTILPSSMVPDALRDPEPSTFTDVSIDVMTEAYTTVQMPAQIGPNQCGSLRYKVDTGAGGNVMPLHIFAKLFPKHISIYG